MLDFKQNVVFFDPDNEMVDWIIEHAAGRTIIEVGCGTGHFAKKLFKAGIKSYIGIDPYMDHMKFMQMSRNYEFASFHAFPYEVGSDMIQKMIGGLLEARPNDFIVILARPCHHPFLTDTTFEFSKLVETLYIGLVENFDIDLDGWETKEINHHGTSKASEVVLQIIGRDES